MEKSRRAAITGIGAVSPVGFGKQNKTNLIAAKSGVDYVESGRALNLRSTSADNRHLLGNQLRRNAERRPF